MNIKLLSLFVISFLISSVLHAQCNSPSAQTELNIGNVRAGILNGGDFWWDGVQSPKYEVPKVEPFSGVPSLSTIFAGGIWLSAKDNNGYTRVSAMTYRGQNRYDFFPGPLSNLTGTTDYYTCEFYNQIWEVLNSDIANHVALANQSLPLSLNQIHPTILNWPAKGNAHITEVTIVDELAPFVDVNSNGKYDPENGDFPKIYGDQCLFWVINDKSGFRNSNHGDPLNVQVQFLAYAYGANRGTLTNTTIYNCQVINKSFGNLHDFHFGLFLDYNWGFGQNDYVACDTLTNTSYSYTSFPSSAPIQACTFLNQDFSLFSIFNNGFSSPYSVPNNVGGIDALLHGFLFDNSPIPNNGFLYPGNPASATDLNSECALNHSGGARRTIQATGPHDLNAWQSFDITWALHTVFPSGLTSCPDFNQVILPEIEIVKDFYENKEITYNYNVVSGLRDSYSLDGKVQVYPNPSQDFVSLAYGELHLESLEIYQYDGRLVSKIENASLLLNLDISNFSKGVYFLQFKFEEGLAVKSLVKE